MAALAKSGTQTAQVRNLAVKLVTEGFGGTDGVAQKDFDGEVRRLFQYVRDGIRYVRDPVGRELLASPAETLATGAGDCDDKSILLAALLGAIGYGWRFVGIALAPGQFSHVWVQANVPARGSLGGRWVDLETTEPLRYGERVPETGVIATIYEEG